MAIHAFGKAVRAVKPATPLISLIEEKFKSKEPQPPLAPDSYIRCSAFSALCPREEVLCAQHGVVREKTIDANLNLIFSHGTALHYILQNKVLPALETVLYGQWSCLTCGSMVGGPEVTGKPLLESLVLRPAACKCSGSNFLYEEVSLRSEQFRITGHPDGFLKLPQYDGYGVLEAKSISKAGAWEVKKTPKMDHVIQAQMYMWFTGTQWSQILYWDKGTNGVDGLIEHHVERDDETLEEMLNSVAGLWRSINALASNGDKALPARICSVVSCPRAGVCSVAKQCFSVP